MIQKIGDKVSVNLLYDHMRGTTVPKHVKWRNTIYTIRNLGLHYTLYRGRTLYHMFSVSTTDHFFLLAFNTESLQWTLEEVADDNAN